MNSKENRLDEEKLITPLHEILSEEGKKKLVDILKFWDDLKGKWAEARKKFWAKYDRDQFLLQLRHAEKKREELINTNQQKLEEIWFFTRWKKKQEKFIAEYLKALSHYGEIIEEDEQEEERIPWREVQKTGFREWVILNLVAKGIWFEWAKAIAQMELKEWVTLGLSANDIWDKWAELIANNLNLKEWVTLDLSQNNIWDKWAKAIAKNLKLKEWVGLGLSYNRIWVEWAKALAKMELKEGVTLWLKDNNIWDDWAEAIAKNLKLKEWVTLDLSQNNIWDKWAKALAQMELKERVTLDLKWNHIWDEWKSILENWVADAKARGINCEIYL